MQVNPYITEHISQLETLVCQLTYQLEQRWRSLCSIAKIQIFLNLNLPTLPTSSMQWMEEWAIFHVAFLYFLYFNWNSNIKFLIDSGTDVSVISPKDSDCHHISKQLFAANGSKIKTYGEQLLNTNLGLLRKFSWPL